MTIRGNNPNRPYIFCADIISQRDIPRQDHRDILTATIAVDYIEAIVG